ncbi:MAG: cell envelope integrity protein TolA, partial [Gammaproteobacteria bacterium]|nr:cell envelope integrity protein TolA [Gammaproteobacteria bacterium]
ASAVEYIRNEIRKRWVRPANARTGMLVELDIQLVPTGEIVNIEITYRDSSATDAFVASVDKAVKKVGHFDKLSLLDPVLFDANFRKFTLKFKPEDLRL